MAAPFSRPLFKDAQEISPLLNLYRMRFMEPHYMNALGPVLLFLRAHRYCDAQIQPKRHQERGVTQSYAA
jgi:hypothetical protein